MRTAPAGALVRVLQHSRHVHQSTRLLRSTLTDIGLMPLRTQSVFELHARAFAGVRINVAWYSSTPHPHAGADGKTAAAAATSSPDSKDDKDKEKEKEAATPPPIQKKEESKLGKTIKNFLAKKVEEQEQLDYSLLGTTKKDTGPAKPALYKRIVTAQWWKDLWVATKHELQVYGTGFKLMWVDIRVSTRLFWKTCRGESLTRRERQQFVRTTSDLLRLVPFSVFIIVPFMELTLPIFLKLFPNMLPSTFQEAKTKEERTKAELKVQLEMARFLQETVEEMAVESKNKWSDKVKEFRDFASRARTQGQISTDEILKFSQLFNTELTLDNISRPQLSAMCKVLGLQSIGTSNFLRFQLRMKIRQLQADDALISQEGVASLSPAELQTACRERGMRALGISEDTLRERLQQWLDLQKEGVPPSLLLMSRILYLPENIPETEKLKIAIDSMPDELKDAVTVELLESEGVTVDPRFRIQLVKKEEERIKQEEAEDKKQEEAAKKSESDAAAAAAAAKKSESEAAAKEQLKDTAPQLKETVKAPTPGAVQPGSEKILSLEEIVDLAVALKMQSGAALEKKMLDMIKEEVSEHKEDVKELLTLTGKSLETPKASTRLSQRLEKMVSKMEDKLATIEKSGKTKIMSALDLDNDGLVTVDELRMVMKRAKKPLSDDKIEAICSALDADHDGVLSVDTIIKVLTLVSSEGADIKPASLKLLVDIIEKENEVETLLKQQHASSPQQPPAQQKQ
eukprot:m.175280 g.175280  ORF g.175280 m.175280 type:complete len:743 (-) comp17344_c0_seq2:159-2387(-)